MERKARVILMNNKATLYKSRATERAYLSKRMMLRALRKATLHLTDDAMERMGYIVTVSDGWVVKKPKVGKMVRMYKLPKVNMHKKIVLD